MRGLMKQTIPAAAVAAAAMGCASRTEQERLAYPTTRCGDDVEVLHGVQVTDPYRWLEDADSAETRAWVEAQNAVTFAWLDQIPGRDAIRTRLTELWDYERWDVPRKEGGRYFLSRNDGLQDQSVLHVIDRTGAEPRVLLDPNTLSSDGTVSLSDWSPSRDGKLLAYGISRAGSDWTEWHVRDVDTARDLPDVLQWVKFSSASWTPDGRGFYYSRYDEPREGDEYEGVNHFQKLWHHRLGTPQSADVLVYERKDQPEWGFGGTVTDDGRWLVVEVWRGTDPRNGVFVKDLSLPDAPMVELLADFDASYQFVGNEGPVLWFHTDRDAPRGRVIAVDVRNPAPAARRELIPQSEDALSSVALVGERFVASYLHHAHSVLRLFELDGRAAGEVDLPGLGSAGGVRGHRGDPETFFSFTSFTTPGEVHRLDVSTGATSVFRRSEVPIDLSAFVTEQVFLTSRDGARIPMFLTYKRGTRRDGANPTFLYGYGGFRVSLTPWYSSSHAAWLEMGGVLAVPNLRGGGEYGEEWHQAGTMGRKQNVFDDFAAAAEWLIANGWTSTPKLAIGGGSNGGLLVGASMTQRPDLFGACLARVGVMDMLRYHRFTIGWAWKTDYGDPDVAEDFRVLHAYSPLHNLRPGTCYPPTLVTTADHDDRVVPAHSFKFAAALQAAQGCANPVLLRVQVRAGHGAGKPTRKIIEQAADEWAFLTRVLGM